VHVQRNVRATDSQRISLNGGTLSILVEAIPDEFDVGARRILGRFRVSGHNRGEYWPVKIDEHVQVRPAVPKVFEVEIFFAPVNGFPSGDKSLDIGQEQDCAMKRKIRLDHIVDDAGLRGTFHVRERLFEGASIRPLGDSRRGMSGGETLDERAQFSYGPNPVHSAVVERSPWL
jgi:hypothetical protein